MCLLIIHLIITFVFIINSNNQLEHLNPCYTLYDFWLDLHFPAIQKLMVIHTHLLHSRTCHPPSKTATLESHTQYPWSITKEKTCHVMNSIPASHPWSICIQTPLRQLIPELFSTTLDRKDPPRLFFYYNRKRFFPYRKPQPSSGLADLQAYLLLILAFL